MVRQAEAPSAHRLADVASLGGAQTGNDIAIDVRKIVGQAADDDGVIRC
jgi:hypothetical protein